MGAQDINIQTFASDGGFFMRNTSDWLWAVDLSGRYTYSSRQSRDLIGYAPEEVVGREYCEFVIYEDEPRVSSIFVGGIGRRENSIALARVVMRKDGRLVALRSVAEPFRDDSGAVAGYIGIDSDVSKYNLEEELRESQDNFSLFMQNFPGGVYIKDSETRLLYFNRRFEELLGVRLDGMIGKTDEEIWGDDFGRKMRAEEMKVLIGGRCIDAEEGWTIAPSGKHHTFISRRFKIPGKDKGPLLGCITIDITERKEIETALARSEMLYNTTINSISDWIFVVDSSLKIVLANDSLEKTFSSLGFSSSLVGAGVESLSGLLPSGAMEIYRGIFAGGADTHNDYSVNASGRHFVLELRNTPVLEGGRVARIVATIRDNTEKRRAEEEVKTTRRELLERYSFGDMVGKSEEMREIFNLVPAVSAHDCNVLIEGPTGTGKSLVAEIIHNNSSRRKKLFCTINCGALPDTLLESELFGYAKGAFTGAEKSKPGKFEAASGGTVFLDEIGEMPLPLQVKLLRVIEKKQYEPLGSNSTVDANVRIIAATNRDLASLVKAGKFRADLYYRLNIVSIRIPPLCERHGDIGLLIDHFVKAFNEKYHRNIKGFEPKVYDFLISYDYPGNVRELQNMLDRAFIFCTSDRIEPSHLAVEYRKKIVNGLMNGEGHAEKRSLKGSSVQKSETGNDVATIVAVDSATKGCETMQGDVASSDKIDRNSVLEALQKNKYNKAKTAKYLNVDRTTLWRWMKKFDIE